MFSWRMTTNSAAAAAAAAARGTITRPPKRRLLSKRAVSSLGLFLLLGLYILLSVWSYYTVHLDIDARTTGTLDALHSHLVQQSSRTPLTTTSTNIRKSRNATRQPRASPAATRGTFVIQVRGEMGNHLQKIAHGHALQWYAQDNLFGSSFSPQLLIRHLKKPKWKLARADIYQCFPQLRSLDYEGVAMQPEFAQVQTSHKQWLATQLPLSQQHPQPWAEQLALVKEETHANITMGLRAMKQLILLANSNTTTTTTSGGNSGGTHYRQYYPIVILGGPMRNALIDKFYQRFRDELFQFDTASGDCCAQLPATDEVVFHFRHFAKELSVKEQQSRGFEELDPQRVASELMGHLPAGQKIAMTTRFANEPIVEDYQRAMQARGFQVRIVANQTGVQDFCFLLRAQQELLGVAKSTYARWAAFLGDAARVQLYALDNVGSQEFIRQTMRFPWTNSEIKRRIQFPVFASTSSNTQSGSKNKVGT